MKKIFLLILIAVAFAPFATEAQEYTLLEPLPCIEGTSTDGTCDRATNTTKTINLNDYIGYIFKFSIALAAFLAVIMIIWGGVQYMTSEVPFLKLEGKNKIGDAIAGLLMVLASYLILATIDPRLVEINTSIEPIVIDTRDSQEFRGKLASDLRALSAETQAKTNGFVATRTALQSELDRVNYAIENDQELDADQLESLKIEKAQLEQKIRGVSVEISKSVATTIGQSSYSWALSAIADPKNYDQNNLVQYTAKQISNQKVDGVYLTDSPNIIQRNYNTKMNEVLKNSDKDEAEKAAEIQMLEKQRDFYINQIAEDININSQIKPLIDESWYSFLKWSPSQKNLAIKNLNENLVSYQQNIADPKKPNEAGVPDAEYKKIMQAKIDLITETLGANQQ